VIASLGAGAALLLGLAAGGHCLVMCGGITAALGMATAKDASGRPRRSLLVAYQLGRIGSYAVAGLLFGGLAGGLIAIADAGAVSRALRVLSGLAMLTAAVVVFAGIHDPAARLGSRLWARLAPLGRRLLPVATPRRALAFGAVWGWMPCGFVYTVLLIATLQADPVRAALTMVAFGVGTLPVMLTTSLGLAHAGTRVMPRLARPVAGAMLLAGAVLTLAAPWLAPEQHGLHGLSSAVPTH
jgi:sulfite exporter TauE/SafE